jgi:uncharacterized protein (TIGR00255 family)
MTGQGEATGQHEGVSISVEIRAVNNRFLKIVSRLSDAMSSFEPQIESIVRQHVRRGSIQLTMHSRFPSQNENYRLNTVALRSYMQQAVAVAQELQQPITVSPGEFVALPGVIEESVARTELSEPLTQAIEQTIVAACKNLNAMRRREGESMEKQLTATIDKLEIIASQIRDRAPNVVTEYRTKLETKIRKVLGESNIEVETVDLLREIQLFADRADICEELVRLASHLQQFRSAIKDPESQGRKLDFLIQEFFREINTIGSKANDATISVAVVELKTLVEQMREIVQNIE